jgi:hypothetical protein
MESVVLPADRFAPEVVRTLMAGLSRAPTSDRARDRSVDRDDGR